MFDLSCRHSYKEIMMELDKPFNFPNGTIWRVEDIDCRDKEHCEQPNQIGSAFLRSKLLLSTELLETRPRRPGSKYAGAVKMACTLCAGCTINLKRI